MGQDMQTPPATLTPAFIQPGTPPERMIRGDLQGFNAAPHSFAQSVEQYQTATRDQANALRAEGEVRAQGFEQQAELERQQNAELEVRVEDFEAEQRERQQARDQVAGEFAELSEQANNMSPKDRRTKAQKVVGTLAIALGGVADGFAAMGGNYGTKHAADVQAQINLQIQRDLEMQKMALDNKRAAAAAKQTEFGMAREALGDAQQAEAFATAQLQRKYATQLRETGANTSREVAKAAAESAATGLETQASETIAKLQANREEQMMRSRMFGARSGSGGNGSGGPKTMNRGQLEALESAGQITGDQARQLEAIRRAEQAGRKPGETAEERAVRAATDPVRAATERGAHLSQDLTVADPQIAPLHSKDPGKLQKQIDSSREVVTLIDKALDIRAKNPLASHLWGTNARGELQSIGTAIQLHGKNIFELGALSGPDMGLIEGIAGKPDAFLDINEAKLKQLREGIVRGTSSALEARGFEAPSLDARPAPAPSHNAPSPAPSDTPSRSGGSDLIPMRTPDGRIFDVPAARAADVERRGAKRVK